MSTEINIRPLVLDRGHIKKIGGKAMDSKFEELKQAVQPVLDFLYKYGDPHTTVIVEMGFVKVVQDKMGTPLEIRD